MSKYRPKEDTVIFAVHSYYYDVLKGTDVMEEYNDPNYRVLFLLSKPFNEYFFKNIPKNFTISTKNTTLHFNLQMLKETSSVISKFVQDNPTENTYFVNISDDENILSKFEQLYQGKSIKFNDSDIPTIQQFTQIFRILNCPNFLKPQNLKNTEIDSNGYAIHIPTFTQPPKFSNLNVEIYLKYFIKFLKRGKYQVFKIKTNKKEYVCNIFSVYMSKVIRQILEKEPSTIEFVYNFEDKNEEFQLICDFFNYKPIDIKNVNTDSLKSIAEDLQIDCVIEAIDNYFSICKKFSEKIEKHRKVIDSIEELFDLLYNVKNYGIEKVKNSIVQSKWSKKEEDVKELSAYILQVIKPSFSLHKEIAELLIELDKEASEDNKLSILLPFTVERLMTLYWPRIFEYKKSKKPNKNNSTAFFSRGNEIKEAIDLTNKCVYSFIRILYKRGVISKEEVFESLESYDLSNNIFNVFFLPELIEKDPKNISKFAFLSRKNPRARYFSTESCAEAHIMHKLGLNYCFYKTFTKYLPDKIEMYEKMLDNLEPDDELTKSLRHDDIDTLQQILSKDEISTVPYNIFDDFEEDISLLNYAALYGSVKCFKYLLQNNFKVNENTLYFAVYGGNKEIMEIADQENPKDEQNKGVCKTNFNPVSVTYSSIDESPYMASLWHNLIGIRAKEQRNFSSFSSSSTDKYNDKNMQCLRRLIDNKYQVILNYCNINNIVAPAIAMKPKEVFDWAFEKTFVQQNKGGNNLKHIAVLAALCGNVHSLLTLIEDGVSLTKKVISKCARNGFYSLTKILLDLYDEESSSEPIHYDPYEPESVSHFGNLSIFKLFVDRMNQFDLTEAILNAIKVNCTEIIKYAFDDADKFYYLQYNPYFTSLSLKSAIITKANDLFNFLKEQLLKSSSELFQSNLYSYLLFQTCITSNMPVVEELTDLILKENPKYDFTSIFSKASSYRSLSICKYFLDKKVSIKFENSNNIRSLGGLNVELFERIINSFDPNDRFLFYDGCINYAIYNKNIQLIEFILKENPPSGQELIEAIKTDDIEVVDTVLKYNNKSSFVNALCPNGSGLCYAVQNGNIEIVKRLLSVPEIDLSLYDQNQRTPLIIAAHNSDYEIFDLILTFYEESNTQINSFLISEAVKSMTSGSSLNLSDNACKIIKRITKIKNTNIILDRNNSHIDNKNLITMSCISNRIDVVEALLSLDNINVNCYDSYSFNTPLIIALELDNLDIAKLLIKYPKTDINLTNRDNESAFTVAVQKKQKEIIELLLNDERFDPKESRLIGGFIYSSIEIAKLLYSCKQLDVNEGYTKLLNSYKINALEHSVQINDVEKIDMIIQHPSFNVHKSRVNNIIFISVEYNNVNVFKKLVEVSGRRDINIRNEEGESLLSYASRQKSGEIVDVILNQFDFSNGNDELLTAFVSCYSERDTNNHDIIEAYQSDFNFYHTSLAERRPIWSTGKKILNPQSLPKKSTAVEIMEKIIHYDSVHQKSIDFAKLLPSGKSFFTVILDPIEDAEAVCGFLLEHGVDLNKADQNGVHPLEHAIQINSLKMVRSLLKTGCVNLHQLDGGDTYLHCAARNKKSSILALLLERNEIDVNAANDRGDTPLMEACKSDCIANINLLFKRDDLDYLHCNKSGKDALDVASVVLQPAELESVKKDKRKYHDRLVSAIEQKVNSNTE